jgi:hypothetical protein
MKARLNRVKASHACPPLLGEAQHNERLDCAEPDAANRHAEPWFQTAPTTLVKAGRAAAQLGEEVRPARG